MAKPGKMLVSLLGLAASAGMLIMLLRFSYAPPPLPKVTTAAEQTAIAHELVAGSKRNHQGAVSIACALTNNWSMFIDYYNALWSRHGDWRNVFALVSYDFSPPPLPWLGKVGQTDPVLQVAWVRVMERLGPDTVAECLDRALGPPKKSGVSTIGIATVSKYLLAACNEPRQPVELSNDLPRLGPAFATKVIKRLLVLRPDTRRAILDWSQHQSRAQLRVYLRTIETLP